MCHRHSRYNFTEVTVLLQVLLQYWSECKKNSGVNAQVLLQYLQYYSKLGAH